VKRNLVTAVSSILASRVLALAMLAITTPFLVRFLEPDQYGTYATLIAVFGLLMILVSSGIDTGARKYLAEERALDGWQDHVFGYYFRLAALLVAVAVGLLVLASWTGLLARSLGAKYTTYVYLVAVLAVAAQFRAYARGALMGLKLEHVSEPLRVLQSASFGVFAVGLVVLDYGVAGVLVGHIVSSVLVIVVALAVIAQHVSLWSVLRPTPPGFPGRELIDFNSLTIVTLFLLFSLRHVDVLMLEAFRASEQVAYYRAALVLTQLLWLVPRSIQAAMIQSTSNLWESGRIDRITEIGSRACRYTLLVTGLLAVGLASLAAQFVPLYYTEAYTPAVLPVLLLLPGTVGFALARPIFAISQAKGDLRPLVAATGTTAGLNLVGNLLLIPVYGMVGAAIATSVAYATLPVFHVVAAHRIGYQPLAHSRLSRIAVTIVATGLPLLALTRLIADPLVAILVVPPVGGVLYAVFAVFTGSVTLDELFELGEALPEPAPEKVAALRRRVENGDGVLGRLVSTGN